MSIFRNILNGFKNSFFAAARKAKYVGSDHYGNRYFEIPADKKHNLRGSRYIEEPKMADPFDTPTIPVEWHSWLRNRRNDPPTEEEIQRNYVQMMQTKMKAKEIEKQYETPAAISENDTSKPPITEDITSKSHKSEFPTYEGFEVKPGQKNREFDDR